MIKIGEDTYEMISSLKGKDSFNKFFKKIFPVPKKRQNQIMNDVLDSLELLIKQNSRENYDSNFAYLIFEGFRAVLSRAIFSDSVSEIVEILNNYADALNIEDKRRVP